MISVPAARRPTSAVPSGPAANVTGDGNHLALTGALEIGTITAAGNGLTKWSKQGHPRSLDIAGLDSLDTPGALFLCGLRDKGVKLTGVKPEHAVLLELICGLDLKPLPKVEAVARWRQIVIQLGKGAHDARRWTSSPFSAVRRAGPSIPCFIPPACVRLQYRGTLRKPAFMRCPSSD
jgi:ABC-type transporter Mla MlaB component